MRWREGEERGDEGEEGNCDGEGGEREGEGEDDEGRMGEDGLACELCIESISIKKKGISVDKQARQGTDWDAPLPR